MEKNVLITGAGTGIGRETALHLAGKGFKVYASAPEADLLEAVEKAANERQVSVRPLLLDVTDDESIRSAVAAIVDECGGIFSLVNNAGLGLRGFFEDTSDTEIRRLFDVNVFGVMAVTRHVLPHMREARKGKIVIMSSAGGRIASMTISGYAAGKFAVEGFGEALALEVAPFGISVSLIEPGLIMTPHFTVNRGVAAAAENPSSPYFRWFKRHEAMVNEILRAKRITPADVARNVHRALTAKRPRLRYVVGWRAQLLISLRKLLPDSLFERLYFEQVKRLVTTPPTEQ